MILALAALLGAALTAAACYAAGAMLIDRLSLSDGLYRFERLPLAFTLGAACLHLAVFAILALHLAYWPVFVVLLLGVIGTAVLKGSWRLRGEPGDPLSLNLKRICILLFGAFTLLYFFHAWAPENSPDGSGYHLGFVLRYLRAHRFLHITTDIYATLSQGIEMLYVPAFAIGQQSAAALVHLAFTGALALAILAYGRRLGKPWVGAAAAFLTYASPVVGIDASSAYIDLGVAAVVFSAFYWLEIWDDGGTGPERPPRSPAASEGAAATGSVVPQFQSIRTTMGRNPMALIPAGLLAGYAYATKYTAFVMVLFALGFVAWRARKIRPVMTIVLFSSLMIAPWMLKNWIIVGNPVAPFGNTIFRNPNFHPMYEQEYAQSMRSYGVTDKLALPLEVTIRGAKTQGILGLVFLLAPLALLALRYRSGRKLLAAALLLGLPYFANVGTRFLIPSLPFISLAMALAIGSAPAIGPALLAALMIVHGVSSWPSEVHRYADKYVWRLDGILFREALRLIPQDEYLRSIDPNYGAAKLVESTVPKGERILGLRGVAFGYCNRDILSSFQGALDQTLIDSMNMGWLEAYQPTVVEKFQFPERTARRFRVLQTAVVDNPDLQWSVHELRFFHQGLEIPRQPQWRLRAWPNPWEVQLAFDNSEATRWRTWESVKPGDYLDVDFGKDQAVDEVRLETSYDYTVFQLQVEVLDGSGHWTLVAKNPKVDTVQPKSSIRLAATYELKAHGIHYFLVGDDDFGSEDFRDDPGAWGLTQVASGYGIRIYRVTE
jgi:hypothetical protein